ncbi:MAG: hypothetical protein KatS3mg055_3106 [Chloroflexus sp.]|uniref:phosphatidylglycerol lysyltransferase domain-containing protein n=1 Tax=Chloroflexus sp. TaxID=1904827 RepID=UPI0021DE5D14|nr:phosphatidylglycerol lysyltransferase domain-containing protein [Chloroflexus sp.]GIV90588.1 MAG: hypothetical protein KatS3mg055_3106 [Chloroflexus sp.]
MPLSALIDSDELPLSWTRGSFAVPRLQYVRLPLSRLTWLAYATLPDSSRSAWLHDHRAGQRWLVRGCPEQVARRLAASGWETFRVGIEGVIDLAGDGLQRRSVRKMARAALRFGQVSEIPWSPAAVARLRWLARESRYGQRPQLRYLFRTTFDPETRLFVFSDTAGVWQGAVLLTQPSPTTAVTELMLRRPQAPAGVMEALFSVVSARLLAEGCRSLSLNEVPFYHLDDNLRPIERLITLIGRQMATVYDSEGLYRFKNKFAPVWRPIYLCMQTRLPLLALADLFTVSGCLELAASGLHRRQAA